jgi:glycosyltransferase involved in cell wall biosynthesis
MISVLVLSRASLFDVPGGDTIQVIETCNHLRKLGVLVDVKLASEQIDYSRYDLIHFFNIIRPGDILLHIRKSNLPFVVSTIFVDYSATDRISRGILFRMISAFLGSDRVEYLKAIARWLINGEKINSLEYLLLGHARSIRRIIRQASVLLPNSQNEYKRLTGRYGIDQRYMVVPNAVNQSVFEFSNSFARSGVLCVATIEPRKNQLALIRAMTNLPFSLTIVGSYSPNNKAYYEQCKMEAGQNIVFLGQLEQKNLFRLYAQNKVHVLPSWFETTGLSSLEAAACGCNVVITRNGDTEDYFGNHAFYCAPDSISSIRQAIINAYYASFNAEFIQIIKDEFNWFAAARKTLESYNQSLKLMNEEKD